MMDDRFIWHIASSKTSWFVTRELRKANERGLRHIFDETTKGHVRFFSDPAKAQKQADKLNKRDGVTSWLTDEQIDWWINELGSCEGISGSISSTMRALLSEVKFTREN